jgi:excisionase family DNA binding protein
VSEERPTATTKAPYTVKEAAEELGISVTLARDLVRGGQLAAYRYGPRKTVIYGEDLEAFKQSRRIEATSKREAS